MGPPRSPSEHSVETSDLVTFIKMAIIENIGNKCWQGYRKTETFMHC